MVVWVYIRSQLCHIFMLLDEKNKGMRKCIMY